MKLILVFVLLLTGFYSESQQRRRPTSGRVWMDIYKHPGFLELELWNDSDRPMTCSGQVTWRYRGSYSDAYQGIWAYLEPNEIYTKNISISPKLRLLYARPDIRCR